MFRDPWDFISVCDYACGTLVPRVAYDWQSTMDSTSSCCGVRSAVAIAMSHVRGGGGGNGRLSSPGFGKFQARLSHLCNNCASAYMWAGVDGSLPVVYVKRHESSAAV